MFKSYVDTFPTDNNQYFWYITRFDTQTSEWVTWTSGWANTREEAQVESTKFLINISKKIKEEK